MIGVKLAANFQKTRQINCDELLLKVKSIIGAWKGGKFMPITERSYAVNTYCLSKVWFKCSSLPLRLGDLSSITATVKSWIYADQLEKPLEIVLFRPRISGGLGLVNVKFKSLSLLVRSFLESSIIARYKHNEYHVTLFQWYVEEKRNIDQPRKSPYYDEKFFELIKEAVKEKGLCVLNFTSGQWYKMLVEKYVTHHCQSSTKKLIPCKAETELPEADWSTIWTAICQSGLSSDLMAFLWRLIHDLLPSPVRLFKLKMVSSHLCTLCDLEAVGDLQHCLLECPYNNGVGQFVFNILSRCVDGLSQKKIIKLDLNIEGDKLPVVLFIANVLFEIWCCRREKKMVCLHSIKANLEAKVNILRKSRHRSAAETLMEFINS